MKNCKNTENMQVKYLSSNQNFFGLFHLSEFWIINSDDFWTSFSVETCFKLLKSLTYFLYCCIKWDLWEGSSIWYSNLPFVSARVPTLNSRGRSRPIVSPCDNYRSVVSFHTEIRSEQGQIFYIVVVDDEIIHFEAFAL